MTARTLTSAERGCTVDDCPRPHKAKGYCNTHYLRVFHGSGTTERKPPKMNEFIDNGDGSSKIIAMAPDGGSCIGLVDTDDVPMLSNYLWFPVRSDGSNTRYLSANMRGKSPRTQTMHVLLMGAPGVDHRNRNGLDNRRSNLRVAEQRENNANRPSRRGAASSYKGVYRTEIPGKWASSIQIDGRKTYLGRFSDEESAARAYDRAAFEAWGEFAYMNFPEALDVNVGEIVVH